MHSAIYEMYAVQQCCIDLWLIREGVGSVCHGYMCILLYMKLMQCSDVVYYYGQLEEWCGVSLPWVYVHSAIYDTYLMQWCCIDLWLIRGGVCGQSAMGICAFCYI